MMRLPRIFGFIGAFCFAMFVLGASLIALSDDIIFSDGFENHPPDISSSPPTVVVINTLYSYNVVATDIDGDLLVYGLVVSPENMTIGEFSGEIRWTPDQLGIFVVEILVSDGNDGTTLQQWDIDVQAILDSDNDGLSDDDELAMGTDPTDSDTDNDGLEDGKEVHTHTTNPLKFDTDEDSFGDGTEIIAATNPLDPDDFPDGPSDPEVSAPGPDPTVTTTIVESTEFLYTGDNPIQIGVEDGTIDPLRATAVRGRVLNSDAEPLAGVTVTVLAHPEYGHTLSRANGMFDMVVNGGSHLTINYSKSNYLTAQRHVNVPGQDWVWAPDAMLIQLEATVTSVDLDQTSEDFVMAQGSVVSDDRGVRQSTLLFPQGIEAELVIPDGSTQAISTLNVRATEYTAGPNGQSAMPAELPLGVGYTYCVELSVDEALSAGAKSVSFSQPVINYVENFLGFPVGSEIPVYYYDPDRGVWIPSQNGNPWFWEQPGAVVLQILGESAGLAELDMDGDGWAEDAGDLDDYGINEAERQRILEQYSVGQTLWRVPVSHFSTVDYNWPPNYPSSMYPPVPAVRTQQEEEESCEQEGSIIECQNQVLGESIGISGTPYSLNYRSNRTPGRKSAYTLDIPLMGATCPSTECPQAIKLEVTVAGQLQTWEFSNDRNQSFAFTWDGKDAFERTVYGAQLATVRLGYEYPAYLCTGPGLCLIHPFITEVLWAEWRGLIGQDDARMAGLGGWTLDVNHRYDSSSRILYLGDGRRIAVDELDRIIENRAGNGVTGYSGDGGPAVEAQFNYPRNMDTGPDGSVFIADQFNNRVRKVSPDGIVTTVAGNGTAGFSGDGGLAVDAMLNRPQDVAVGADGSVFIVDRDNFRVRKISPDGVISTFAGNGNESPSWGDYTEGVPATEGSVMTPLGIAIAPDQTVYVTDKEYHTWRIDPAGIKWLFAGWCAGFGGDGGQAYDACFRAPSGVAVAENGEVFLADSGTRRIRKIGLDGIVSTVAGDGNFCYDADKICGDGGPALDAKINPTDVAVDRQGNIYIADSGARRIRKVNPEGIISSIAGNGEYCYPDDPCGDGGLATAASMTPRFFTLRPNGDLLYSEQDSNRVREIKSALPGSSVTDYVIASKSGTELYVFDAAGRHLRTVSTMTSNDIQTFTYDSNGFLLQVEDADSNITIIERESEGTPVAIIGPYGQRTELALDEHGFLSSISNPASETWQFAYMEDGLLTTATDPNENAKTYSYNDSGLLILAEDAATGSRALARTDFEDGFDVTMTSGMGRIATYRVEQLDTGDQLYVNTPPCNCPSETIVGTDGTQISSSPEGVVTTIKHGPDPRFGMQASLVQSMEISTPLGLNFSLNTERTVSLADESNPLSLQTLTDTSNINGHMFVSSYDATTRTRTRTTPAGRIRTDTFNEQGKLIEIAEANFEPVKLTYDTHGRIHTLVQGIGAMAREISFTYDPSGYLTGLAYPMTGTVAYEYDAAGRVTRQVFAGGREILYGYDAAGNVVSVTPPGRPEHRFSYSPVNRPLEYTPPELGAIQVTTNYVFNPDRQLIRINRPDGSALVLGFDNAGRVDSRTLPRGTVSYAYDESTGLVSSITAPGNETLSFVYDGILLLERIWGGTVNGSVEQTHNSNFQITSRSVNGEQSIAYNYDQDGLLTQAGSLSLSRDSINGLITDTSLGASADVRSYNDFGEILTFHASHDGSTRFSTEFTRDELGRITDKVETIEGTTNTYDYSYDSAGRLTEVAKDAVVIESYTYDDNGNRLSANGISSDYDDQDRHTQYGSYAYTYTNNGELNTKTTGSDTTMYTYDILGNLVQVILPDTTQIEYVIDGSNRRIGKKVDDSLVQGFLYRNQLNPIAELDPSGTEVSRFIYASRSNVPDYMIRNGITYRIISDHLGSPRLVIDIATGIAIQRLDYDAFGRVTTDTNPGFQPFGFAGGMYDPDTGLTRFGARDYDAETGHWTAKDPVLFAGVATNLYGYVLSDPINFIDLNGLAASAASADVIRGGLGGPTTSWADLAAGEMAGFVLGIANGLGADGLGAGLGVGQFIGEEIGNSISYLNREYAATLELQSAQQLSDLYDRLIREHQEREIQQLMDEIRELLYGCD